MDVSLHVWDMKNDRALEKNTLGAKRDAIFDYLKDALPKTKTQEQQERMVGNILSDMKEAGAIIPKGRIWYLKQS